MLYQHATYTAAHGGNGCDGGVEWWDGVQKNAKLGEIVGAGVGPKYIVSRNIPV
jgi:hypothetical protein